SKRKISPDVDEVDQLLYIETELRLKGLVHSGKSINVRCRLRGRASGFKIGVVAVGCPLSCCVRPMRQILRHDVRIELLIDFDFAVRVNGYFRIDETKGNCISMLRKGE